MAKNRYLRNSYFKQFTFFFFFDISHASKKLYVTRHDDLSLLAQLLVLNELKKDNPFDDIKVHNLKPTKYTESRFENESMKLLQLIRNLCSGRKDCPIHWLWLYKYRAGFKDDDAKLIEQCLYNLIETEQIEVISIQHSFNSDKGFLTVKPTKYLRKYEQKYELINANATIERFKKGKV